jgi:hypothetical protein
VIPHARTISPVFCRIHRHLRGGVVHRQQDPAVRRYNRIWTVLAKALGEKAHPHDQRLADRVAWVRLAILLSYMVTNGFIVAGVIRHWNDTVR